MDLRTRLLGTKRLGIMAAAAIVAVASAYTALYAQSGRGRQPAPAPKPAPAPGPALPKTTVLGVPEGGKLVKQDLDGSTSRYILKNGLTVIIRERHSAPLFSINLTVRAGTVNEPDEMVGIARLVRWAILQGSATRSGHEFLREVARLGGKFDSESSYDLTSFRITAAAESYQTAVELLGDLVAKPALRPDRLQEAARKALVEARQQGALAENAALDGLMATAFTTSRLRRGMGVSEQGLNALTVEQAQAFYDKFYNPSNMVITVVGDLFSIQALGQIQLQFGAFGKGQQMATQQQAQSAASAASKAKPAVAAPQATIERFVPNAVEAPPSALKYGNGRMDIGASQVSIGYRLPDIAVDKDGLKELATYEVMAAVLGLGKGSRLWQGLREGMVSRDKQSVALEASARFLTLPGADRKPAGMLQISLVADKDRIDRAEAEFFREMERFRRELPSEGELQRARVMLEKRYIDLQGDFETEAVEIARCQARLGDYRVIDTALERIRAVTAQDIQQAAARHIVPARAAIYELEPDGAQARTFTPEKFAELLSTFAPGAGQPVKPEEVKPALVLKTFQQGAERVNFAEARNVIVASVPVPIRDFSVLRGPRAYVREDKSQPRLVVSVLFQGGRLMEDRTTSGLTELMLRSMLKSTTSRKFDLIALELENYGGSIEVVNEPDFYGFQLDVLSRNAEPAIRLLLDIIENPFFDKDELAKERDLQAADGARRRDDPAANAEDLMWSALYPGHPYGLPRYGLAEVVRSATDAKLEEWHLRTIKRQFPLVLLVGDTDGSALVSRIFSEGLKRDDIDKTLKVNIPTTLQPPQDAIDVRGSSVTAQSIGVRILGQAIGSYNDLYALEMIGQMAACGRPVEEVVWKENLAAGVSFNLFQRLASGAFALELATLPAGEQKAREILVAELKKLAAAPPDDSEFEIGRNASIGRYAIALQSHALRSIEYARAIIFGRKPSDIESQPDSIRTVRKSDIKRMAEAIFKTAQPGRGVVRPKDAAKPTTGN